MFSSQQNVEYTYSYDEQRIKAVTKVSGAITNTRYYFGDYEKDVTGSVTKHIFYISGGDGLNAIAVRENNVNTFHYTYTDHLGSIVALTNSVGYDFYQYYYLIQDFFQPNSFINQLEKYCTNPKKIIHH